MQPYEHGGKFYDNSIKYDFSENINPLGMPEVIRRTIAGCPVEFEKYPDSSYSKLRQAISEYTMVDMKGICPGNGADELIWKLMSVIKPKHILVPAPTFSEYGRCASMIGAIVQEYYLRENNNFEIEDSFLECITSDIDIIFICNPNNPTGKLVRRSLLEKILCKADSCGCYVVVDESFIEFTNGNSICDLIGRYKGLLVLRGFTKIFGMAGIRLGYLLGEENIIQSIREYGPLWNVSAVADMAGRSVLSDRDMLVSWLRDTKEYVKREWELLSKMEGILPSDANFALVKTVPHMAEELYKRGIAVRDCSNFTGLDSSYIRIGVKNHVANVFLLDAYKEIMNG